ncbi:hypothetical protein SAMN04487970_10796 [Paenibacillus tianmuensis]|uniref:Uncharacterized protein n=1 Tax=Paenibacillus tianmuensis TaxID=624147 RepID=A0A1G4TYE0_9BACL|nr:hypothetical protein [Paenibacillus tianmuensis]SCW86416.1 hypothetical protein SAMN04487970_10796 [Paenibacillus tianmuensis]
MLMPGPLFKAIALLNLTETAAFGATSLAPLAGACCTPKVGVVPPVFRSPLTITSLIRLEPELDTVPPLTLFVEFTTQRMYSRLLSSAWLGSGASISLQLLFLQLKFVFSSTRLPP